MQTVYEGQIILTNRLVDYDYLEIKYSATTYSRRKPCVIVPVSYTARMYKERRETTDPANRTESVDSSFEGLNLDGNEKLLVGEDVVDEALDNSYFRYDNNDECCLIINYVKEEIAGETDGILGLNEFSGFTVRKSRIVHVESYRVLKPFHIEEFSCDAYKMVKIRQNIIQNISLLSDDGEVVRSDDGYRVFGRSSSYTIVAKDIHYVFPSNVVL